MAQILIDIRLHFKFLRFTIVFPNRSKLPNDTIQYFNQNYIFPVQHNGSFPMILLVLFLPFTL